MPIFTCSNEEDVSLAIDGLKRLPRERSSFLELQAINPCANEKNLSFYSAPVRRSRCVAESVNTYRAPGTACACTVYPAAYRGFQPQQLQEASFMGTVLTVITAINKNSELTQNSLIKTAVANLQSNGIMTMRPSCSNAPLFAPNLGGLNIRSPAVSATYFSELISKKKLELCS